MKIHEGTVTTMTELLERMVYDGCCTRKAAATLRILRVTPPEICVIEVFEDSKKYANSITKEGKAVASELFEQALAARYIGSMLESGCVSDREFRITTLGEQERNERTRVVGDTLKQLSEGKGMRVCDLRLNLPDHVSEEVVQDVLKYLVGDGYVESYEHGDQAFYLRTQKRKVA